ncbi:hypothetical protein [Aliiglaciecola sp. LCG003]|uniref:hypothetical protein n=1 Tax=Aliiglaciecola sp. LCG003 TaxID=3053655 RepID=UPI0025727780|nr:hypothetical protein [Aliiglaciecola sp. LCG003]WJG09004.1 hypothetical protein QR722_16990 [Aliiglaciecola sp. LCG003]
MNITLPAEFFLERELATVYLKLEQGGIGISCIPARQVYKVKPKSWLSAGI